MKLLQFKNDIVLSTELSESIGRGNIACKGSRRKILCQRCIFYTNICNGYRYYTDSKENFKDNVKF